MTERQREFLDFLKEFQAKQGFPPSQREVATHFGITVRAVYDHLRALEKKGHIRRLTGRSRGIQFTESALAGLRRIPIVGYIAAGTPILTEENRDGEIAIDGARFARGQYFAVRVKGQSMIDAHILDSDLAIIRQQPHVEQGEIVAVAVDGEVTLKKFYRTRRGLELRPANRHYAPIVVTDKQEVRLLGKYCGLVRVRR